MTTRDIHFTYENGIWDISVTKGDLTETNGLDTAILMSLFLDKRANKAEVYQPEKRRGWWGNIYNGFSNYQIGSKLWLFEQSRCDGTTAMLAKTYAAESLQWMITDKLCTKIDVFSEILNNGIVLQIILYKNNVIIYNNYFNLWEQTKWQ